MFINRIHTRDHSVCIFQSDYGGVTGYILAEKGLDYFKGEDVFLKKRIHKHLFSVSYKY